VADLGRVAMADDGGRQHVLQVEQGGEIYSLLGDGTGPSFELAGRHLELHQEEIDMMGPDLHGR
jgi:hypothetical protein